MNERTIFMAALDFGMCTVHGKTGYIQRCRTVDPAAAEAVELAAAMVAAEAENAAAGSTLGVPQCRAGHRQAAIESLDKSIRLGNGSHGHDFLFSAMAHQQLGNTTQAREWSDQGVKWPDERRSADPEMLRFRDEAAQLLGVTGSR